MQLCLGSGISRNSLQRLVKEGYPNLAFTSDDKELRDLVSGGRPFLKKTRKVIDDLGIKVCQIHAPYGDKFDLANFNDKERENALQEMEKWLECCYVLGSPILVIHVGGGLGVGNSYEWQRVKELNFGSFSRLARKAKGLSVKIAVENLYDRVARKGGRFYGSLMSELKEIIEHVGTGNIGICFDTGHANIQELDLSEAIIEAGKSLLAVHLGDNDGKEDQHLLPYGGTIDWKKVMVALREIKYSGSILLEGKTPPAPLDSLAFDYWRKVMDGLTLEKEENVV